MTVHNANNLKRNLREEVYFLWKIYYVIYICMLEWECIGVTAYPPRCNIVSTNDTFMFEKSIVRFEWFLSLKFKEKEETIAQWRKNEN